MNGIEARTLLSGARYLRVHYSADPEKDLAWAEQEKKDVPRREWAQQMEMAEDIYDGQPVFADYADSLHCPEKFRQTGLPRMTYAALIGGWDVGSTIHPAFILLGITEMPYQVHCLLEVTSDSDSMEAFAPKVGHALRQALPGQWSDVRHVGDPTVTTKSGQMSVTAQQVCKNLTGWTIHPSTNVWEVRRSAVDWLLTDRISEKSPRFILDARCKVLRKGFQGAYHYDLSPRGDTVGEGRILLMPVKDGYSHPQDALQYGAIEARKIIQGRSGGKVHRRKA